MDNLTVNNLNDSHFHLLEMIKKDIDIDEVLNTWKKDGGNYLIDIGINEDDYPYRRPYSLKYNFIYHSVGIHPNNAGNSLIKRISILERYLKEDTDNIIVAIGETGLDYYWDTVEKNVQKEFFTAHIELAIKYDKPIIIHNRDASSDIIEILTPYKGQINGIIHCYSSNVDFIKKFLSLGFYISYAGNLTYKNNQEIQETLKYIPLDRLLIETDSPYLSPIPKRGRLNNPNNIKYLFEYIQNFLKVNELKKILETNTTRIFKL